MCSHTLCSLASTDGECEGLLQRWSTNSYRKHVDISGGSTLKDWEKPHNPGKKKQEALSAPSLNLWDLEKAQKPKAFPLQKEQENWGMCIHRKHDKI